MQLVTDNMAMTFIQHDIATTVRVCGGGDM